MATSQTPFPRAARKPASHRRQRIGQRAILAHPAGLPAEPRRHTGPPVRRQSAAWSAPSRHKAQHPGPVSYRDASEPWQQVADTGWSALAYAHVTLPMATGTIDPSFTNLPHPNKSLRREDWLSCSQGKALAPANCRETDWRLQPSPAFLRQASRHSSKTHREHLPGKKKNRPDRLTCISTSGAIQQRNIPDNFPRSWAARRRSRARGCAWSARRGRRRPP